MRVEFRLLAAALVVVPVGLRAQETDGQLSVPTRILAAEFVPTADEVFAHVQFLASDEMQGRASGSEEAAAAAKYIAERFESLGLEQAGKPGFEQQFPRMITLPATDASDASGIPSGEVRLERLTCRNVLAWLPGSDEEMAEEFILVGAHFDHLGRRGDAIYNGADDNASGVAGMLAVARACAVGAIRPRRSILFVAFGAEEQGLMGSRYLARHPPRSLQRAVAMINLDMIGRDRFFDRKRMAPVKKAMKVPDAPTIGVIGADQSPELGAIARAVFAAAELPLLAPSDYPLLRGMIEKQTAGRSDHAPFEERGIPFLFFSTSENDDYHQPTDTVDKVDPQTLWRAAQCVYRVVLAIDALDRRPTLEK